MAAVEPLTARDAEKLGASPPRRVGPVEPAAVEATLPHLPGLLAPAVRFQLLTGARPDEALRLRGDLIERRSAGLWIYRPTRHKTASRGHVRQVFLSPEAIELVMPHLDAAAQRGDAYALSPRRAQAERGTIVNAGSKRPPGECYTRAYYTRAVAAAAKAAGVQHWHPHQLRHTAATEFARLHGWEAARIWLGHSSLDVTRLYAEDDLLRIERLVSGDGGK